MKQLTEYLKKYSTQHSLKSLFLAATLMLLAGCPAPGGYCIDADEWGQTEDITVRVAANQVYSSAGINVLAGAPLKMTIGGNVDLCPDATVINAFTEPTANNKPIKPSVRGWQDSGHFVHEGDKITINVDGSYNDRTGPQSSGAGLYAYIKNGPITAEENGDWWYGEPMRNDFTPESNRLAMSGANCHMINGKCNPFFELYKNGTTGEGGGYSGIAPVAGKLYFRYARTASARGMDNRNNGRYSPWKGIYRWEQNRCDACRLTTIINSCAPLLLPFGALCIMGWTAGCDASGHLELAWSDGRYRSKKCQEWYPTGMECRQGHTGDPGYYFGDNCDDHFVNENAAPNVYNSGTGYDITISHGCPGQFGKYMEMVIGSSSAAFVNETVQKTCPPNALENCKVGSIGCEAAAPGCEVKYDNMNRPIKKAIFTINSQSNTDMNSSGSKPDGSLSVPPLPFGFTKRGVYDNTVPAGGELWFKILDTASEKSVNNPHGGIYSDNIGAYDVHIVTSKVHNDLSTILNGIVKPVRKQIFGYCRTFDNPETAFNEAASTENLSESQCPSTDISRWQPGVTQRIYNRIVGDQSFINTIRLGLALSIMFYGFAYMMGMVSDLKETMMKRVIKASIVLAMISPGSWSLFNNFLFGAFIDTMNSLIGLLAGDFMGAVSNVNGTSVGVPTIDNPFAFLDGTITKFFNYATLAKLLGLLFASPIGIIYIFFLLAGMAFFLLAVLRATVMYLLSMIVIALLISMAPIFIGLLLFERTKGYFDSWVKSLISYLFQPVLVFTALAIFNVFVYSALYATLHYRVCWLPVLSLNFSIPGTDLSFGPIEILHFFLPDSGVNGESLQPSGMPMGFFMILIYLIILNGMLKFIDFMANLTSSIVIGGAKLTEKSNQAVASAGKLAKLAGGALFGKGKEAAIAGWNAAKSKGKDNKKKR